MMVKPLPPVVSVTTTSPLGPAGSLMVKASLVTPPSTAFVGVPSVKISVGAAPGSDNSVPIITPLVSPAGMTRGLTVKPL